jgi:trehalose 6-phosphate synthase/phosphatase
MRSASSMILSRGGAEGRVLIVSNRLPVTAQRNGNSVTVVPSAGGLATGLSRAREQWETLWIGWSGLADGEDVRHHLSKALADDFGSIAIPLSDTEIAGFYRHFSNTVLWPALHGLIDQPVPSPEDWHIYQRVNERYADAVAHLLEPADRVWVNDYHLMLVPRLIRERRPAAAIGFFLHTPFPGLDDLAAVPQYEALLEGVLGADVVGFHTVDYARQFLETVEAVLPYRIGDGTIRVGDRHVRVCAEPMGIDVTAFERLAAQPEILAEVKRISERFDGALMLGVDRLDYTKGILQRLLAFEQLLELQPQVRGRVRLVQVAVPTRADVHAYQDLRQSVEVLVERINASFGRSDWIPVDYLFGTVDLNTLVVLYRAADVMLVTPLRDGLNLVAKEFVASRPDGDGVLVLSRHAGAAAELHASLLVDPTSIDELAGVYGVALAMSPAERRARMRRLRLAVARNDVFGWSRRFIDRLCERRLRTTHPMCAG